MTTLSVTGEDTPEMRMLDSSFRSWCLEEWATWRRLNPPPMPKWEVRQLFEDWPRDWELYIIPRSIDWWARRGRTITVEGWRP